MTAEELKEKLKQYPDLKCLKCGGQLHIDVEDGFAHLKCLSCGADEHGMLRIKSKSKTRQKGKLTAIFWDDIQQTVEAEGIPEAAKIWGISEPGIRNHKITRQEAIQKAKTILGKAEAERKPEPSENSGQLELLKAEYDGYRKAVQDIFGNKS